MMETYINFTVKHVLSIEKTNEPDTYWVLFDDPSDISIYGPCSDEAEQKFRHAVKTCVKVHHGFGCPIYRERYCIRIRIEFDGPTFDEFLDNALATGRVDGILTINEVNACRTVHKFEITRVNPRTAFTINRVVDIRETTIGNLDDNKFLIFFETDENGEPKIDIYSEDHDTISVIKKKLIGNPAMYRYYLVVNASSTFTEPHCKNRFLAVDGCIDANNNIVITSYEELNYREENDGATYDFTITSVMSINKPTMKGYDPNIRFVTFRSLDCIEYKGSSRKFHNYIFNYVSRREVYDKIGASYYSLGMVIPPEILRNFEDAIDPQMLKCRLYVTNTMEKFNGQLVPATQFKFAVKDVVSVYEKEEKDMRSKYCAADTKVTEALFYRFNPHHFIKKVIYNDPATIIFWSDGTKTIVKCMEDEDYDPEKGFMAAVTKKVFGDKYGWVLRHHVKPAVERKNKMEDLIDSLAIYYQRKNMAQDSVGAIRDQMLASGATPWELETFDRFVRKYISEKEEK